MQKQNKKNIRILIVLLVIAVIAGITYWVWVKSIALPIKGEMEDFEMETVSGETYNSAVDTIKLFSFIESECSERCAEMLDNLHNVQEKLIEYGSFGKTVDILSVTEPQIEQQTLEQYVDQYAVNQNGWHVLIGSEDQVQSLAKQLGFTQEKEGSVYLVDVNRAIRQEYVLSDESNIDQLLDDITQLIRIHQQFLREEE